MKIKTLSDLEKAGEKDIREALAQVAEIMDDLEKYQEWLASSETTTVVTTTLRRSSTRSLGIHPSSACKDDVCLLKLYLECTGLMKRRRPYDPVSQRTWDIGTMLHDTYQRHFSEMYEGQFQDEVHLSIPEYKVTSSTDGIFNFRSIRSVLEMKSIKEGGSFGWEKIQLKPFDENVRQSHFYMKAGDIPFALILYINKNAGKLKGFPIRFDPNIWEEVESRVLIPVVNAASKKTPDKLDPDNLPVEATAGFACRYCDFEHSCPVVRKEETNAKRRELTWEP